MTTEFRNIDSPEMAEKLRILRNECAEWMTKDTGHISSSRQKRFFYERVSTGKVEGFLMYDNDEPVAYGLIVWDDEGRAWSSTGVKASRRGCGFGKRVFIENVRRAHAKGVPMWLEVRSDNAGQQSISRSTGCYVLDTFQRNSLMVDLMRCDELPVEYR